MSSHFTSILTYSHLMSLPNLHLHHLVHTFTLPRTFKSSSLILIPSSNTHNPLRRSIWLHYPPDLLILVMHVINVDRQTSNLDLHAMSWSGPAFDTNGSPCRYLHDHGPSHFRFSTSTRFFRSYRFPRSRSSTKYLNFLTFLPFPHYPYIEATRSSSYTAL